jgi:UDP-N-acetylmuramyl pentapeptide synthase
VGKSFQGTKNSFNCYATVNDLIQEIQKNPLKNNFILVKGSHGIHLEKILEYI